MSGQGQSSGSNDGDNSVYYGGVHANQWGKMFKEGPGSDAGKRMIEKDVKQEQNRRKWEIYKQRHQQKK